MSDSGSSSITSGPDNGMLPRRVSNNRADLSGDQQMNYLLSWFSNWSELQKADFVPVLASRMKAGKAGQAVNGDLADGIKAMDTNSDRPPSLFSCQVRKKGSKFGPVFLGFLALLLYIDCRFCHKTQNWTRSLRIGIRYNTALRSVVRNA